MTWSSKLSIESNHDSRVEERGGQCSHVCNLRKNQACIDKPTHVDITNIVKSPSVFDFLEQLMCAF